MDFLDQIIEYDKELFIYLNNWGSEPWDEFWLTITNQFSWIPLFLLLFYFIFKAYGWKKGLVLVLVAAALVTFSDQFVNLIKNGIARLRPNNDPTVKELIRILKNPKGFSFISGHSTTSFAVTTFMILTLRKYYKYTFSLLIWPLLFAYSRIYLGVHFPLDIFIGMLVGILIGILFYKISLFFLKKVAVNS
ncbi:phosphatase PAP2 family protein [Aureibaculum sp. 2210JD6-5]|uniref:phosphatase PAP2 family protein n=1 Tax=Aureibaculum sp. 2210JD6-5 TaxID=3103957 RepID=UPI002AAC5B24|nr:phosphatase PAP2 family protein [Aureibaculum sp. 2210JD6-5]MDY7395699.1 phosphatase PAP2 family protein [Aureibaculum sp. 2210JD6-5]